MLNGKSPPNQNCSSYGQFQMLIIKAYMASISNEQLQSAAMEMSQSPSEHCTLYSSDYEEKDTLIQLREHHWEAVPEGNTTISQVTGNNSYLPLSVLLKDYNSGGHLAQLAEENELVAMALNDSLIIKWGLYPLSLMLGLDEQLFFRGKMMDRQKLIQRYNYPKWFICFWDLGCVVELLWRYITTSLH